MSILFPIIAIVTGLLAASSVVIKKLPDASEIIQKLKPYEAFIGASALLMGCFNLLSITRILRIGGISMLMILGCIAACVVMGFLLGYPVLQDLLLDELSEDARNKSAELYEKLTPYKITAGLVGMGTGLYILIF